MDGSPLAEAGIPVPEVTTDINGNPRSPDLPTIGAYECVTKTASTTGGTGPFTYSWSIDRPLATGETITGASTATVSVCLISPANLCLTVTDDNNCVATDCAMINAEDVRCTAGNSGNHKVMVCHNGHNICVDYHAVPAHLAHGDYIGSCVTSRANRELPEHENEESEFMIFPNPSGGEFFIQQKNVSLSPVVTIVRIVNANGQVVKQFSMDKQLAKKISIDNAGLYLIQFIQGNKTYTQKIVVAD